MAAFGQAGEVARQVADVRPAAVLVAGEVAHVVEPVLDVPVAPDEGSDLVGAIGCLVLERSFD